MDNLVSTPISLTALVFALFEPDMRQLIHERYEPR
jgi:hypothetical protein